MNETFLALSMCLCIGLFWAILFEEAQSLTLLLKKELNPLNEEQDDKHE